MDNNKNQRISNRVNSSSKKFNTDLFNRPFTGSSQNSVISEQSNNSDNSIGNISFNKSLSISDSNKKRKPFDNLRFKDKLNNDVNLSNSVGSGKNPNVTDSMPKSNAETEITANRKVLKLDNNNNYENEIDQFNKSKLSLSEKSAILRTQSAIDKETVNKALKFNKANSKENCPFWVKFFMDENPQLKETSSYFKAKDKEKYIRTMIEITRNDAKLEEVQKMSKESKEKSYNQLKLLLTEIKEDENKKEQEIDKQANAILEEPSANKNPKKKKKKDENKINPKEHISSVVEKYENTNKRQTDLEKFYDVNYYDYKLKQKQMEESKKENFVERNIREVEEINLNKYAHSNWELNIEEIYKEEDPYPSIDQLDPEKENYEKVAFRYYGKDVLKRLFEIDSKLEKINPAHKNFSTKTQLKTLKENSKKQNSKQGRVENMHMLVNKYKHPKEKFKKEEDFINRNADIGFKKELKSIFNDIDNQILVIVELK
jgi:hypothetical protein